MGIPSPLIEFFLQEHRYRPWEGNLLTLGRQTVLVDALQLQRLLDKYGMSREGRHVQIGHQIDQLTVTARQNPDKQYVTDATLFLGIGKTKLDVLDVTDYEGANIIHDLCQPVPLSMVGKYDVIFNGSVLDNIFDPAAALRNMTRLLSPTGRVIHIEMASNLAFEYLIYSTDWFLDYYVANGFVDCRIYVCAFDGVQELLHGPWHVYGYMPRPDGTGFSLRDLNIKQAVVVVIAEKQVISTVDITPVQWNYRDVAMKESFNKKLAALSEARPVFGFGRGTQPFSALKLGGFLDCGVAGG